MIHYITTNGVGSAWVGNELRAVKKARIDYVLHALRAPEHKLFDSKDIRQIDSKTLAIYPISYMHLVNSLVMAPFLFRGNFFSALLNNLFSQRESFAVRIRCIGHFLVACCWVRDLRGETVDLIHSQWIHSSGTVGMYGAWLLDESFGFTGQAADLFRDRSAFRDKIKRAEYIICISIFSSGLFSDLRCKTRTVESQLLWN